MAKKLRKLSLEEVVDLSMATEKSKVRKLQKENLMLKKRLLELDKVIAEKNSKLLTYHIKEVEREHENAYLLESGQKDAIEKKFKLKNKSWGFDTETGEIQLIEENSK